MPESRLSRRGFFAASAGTGAAAAAWSAPQNTGAAARAAGIRPEDLAIKEVKVYVLKRQGGGAGEQLAAVVTNSGIEGNYVPAPTKPGLGYEIDRDVLDNMILRVER